MHSSLLPVSYRTFKLITCFPLYSSHYSQSCHIYQFWVAASACESEGYCMGISKLHLWNILRKLGVAGSIWVIQTQNPRMGQSRSWQDCCSGLLVLLGVAVANHTIDWTDELAFWYTRYWWWQICKDTEGLVIIFITAVLNPNNQFNLFQV